MTTVIPKLVIDGTMDIKGGIAVSKHMNVSGNIGGDTVPAISTWTGYASGSYNSIAYNQAWVRGAWSPILNLFAIVSNTNGYVMTSANGTTWIIVSAANTNGWYGICWSPKYACFIAVALGGTSNKVMTSTNGSTWTQITNAIADAGSWYDICWSSEIDIFCAVGTNGAVMTSLNGGSSWTRQICVGSLSFAGTTTSYISVPYDASLNMGTGDFTIEWHQYMITKNVVPRIFSRGTYPNATIAVTFEGGSTSHYFALWINGTVYQFGPTGQNYSGNWYHFAITRSAGTLRTFLNGTQLGNSLNASSLNITHASNNLIIGNESDITTASAYKGYLYGFNWVNGVAKYTADFSAPTYTTNQNTVLYLTGSDTLGKLSTTASEVGITTISEMPPIHTMRSIIWIAELNLFVAVAQTQVFTSINGTTWTANNDTTAITSVAVNWNMVEWCPLLSIIVAVGSPISGTSDKVIMTSSNARDWTIQTAPSACKLWAVKWSSSMGKFVAVGESGVAISSTNGTNWVSASGITTTGTWRGLTWAPEIKMYCAIGYQMTLNTPAIMVLSDSYNKSIPSLTSVNVESGNKAIFNDGLNQGSIQQLSTDLTLSSTGNKVAVPLNQSISFNSTIASYATPITGINTNTYVNPANGLTYIASASSIELSPSRFAYYAFDGVSSTYWGNESNSTASGNIGTTTSPVSFVSPGNILGSGVSVNQLVINSCSMYGPTALTTAKVATIFNYTAVVKTQTYASYITAVYDNPFTKMTRIDVSIVSGNIYVYQVDARYVQANITLSDSTISAAYTNGIITKEADNITPRYRVILFNYNIVSYKYELTTGEYIGTNTTSVQNVGTVSGEWLQIQLPFSMINNYYLLRGRDSINQYFMPRQYYIIGSNNGTTWYPIDYRSDPSTSGGPINFELSYNLLSNTSSYSYYRIIISKVYPNAYICYLAGWTMTGLADTYSTQTTAYRSMHKIDPTDIHTNLSGYDILKQTLSLQNTSISTVSIGDSNLIAFCLGTIQKNTVVRGIFIYTVSAVASGCQFGLYKARTGERVASTPINSALGANTINYINLLTPYTADETTVYYLGIIITSATTGLSINHSYYNYGLPVSVSLITSTLCRMTQYTPANSYTTGILPDTIPSPSITTWTSSQYNVFCGAYGNFALNLDSTLIYYYPYQNTFPGKELWNYRKYYTDGTIVNDIASQTLVESNSLIQIEPATGIILATTNIGMTSNTFSYTDPIASFRSGTYDASASSFATGSDSYYAFDNNATNSQSFPLWQCYQAIQNNFYSIRLLKASAQYGQLSSTSRYAYDTGTVEAWIKLDGNSGTDYCGIIVKQNAYGLFVRSNQLVVYDWRPTDGGLKSSNYTLTINTWYHVAFKFGSGSGTLYVNGAPTTSFSYGTNGQATALVIGNGGTSSGQYFNGYISQVRIWDTALSDATIANNYNKIVSVSTPGLTGYWKMNEGTGTTLTNIIINNSEYNFTLVPTLSPPTWSTDIPILYDFNILYTQLPYTTGGVYVGGGAGYYWTTPVIGQGTISGEWLQIKMPYLIKMTGYTIRGQNSTLQSNSPPKTFYIVGSIDRVNWYPIDSQSSVSYTAELSYTRTGVTTSGYYNNFRIICQETLGQQFVGIASWEINGVPGVKTPANPSLGFTKYSLSFLRTASQSATSTNVSHSLSIGTIEFWVKQNSGDALDWTKLIGCGYNIYSHSGGQLTLLQASPNVNFITSSVIANGNWHHIAFVFENGVTNGSTLYFDGLPANLGSFKYSFTPSQILQISERGTGENYYTGLMDEIRLWNVKRTSTEILNNYNRRVSPTTPGLVSYWQCNEGTGATVANLMSGGTALTLVNSPTWSTDVPTFNYVITQKIGMSSLQLYRSDLAYNGYSIDNVNVHTVSAWVNTIRYADSISSAVKLFVVSTIPAGKYSAFQAYIPPGSIYKTDSTFASASYGALAWTGQWAHLCMVVNTSTCYFYANGALVATVAFAPITGYTGLQLTLGASTNQAGGYQQYVDDVRIYGRALNQNEVLSLYNYRSYLS